MAKAKPNVDGADALASLKADLESKLGSSLSWGSADEFFPEKVPLGLKSFDDVLGGGFSMARMTLLAGEESAGKTLIAMRAMRMMQERDLPCVFIDVERSWTSEWATMNGIDPSKVIVSSPENGEKAFDVLHAVVQTSPAGIIVLDSIAAMPPAAEMDAISEQQFMGTQARMVNKGLRTLNAKNSGGWMIIIVNQIREKLGVVYGNPETLPGGKGQRYYAWQIVRVRKGAAIEEGTGKDKKMIGRIVRIKMDKNKQSPPGAEAEVSFYFTGDFDTVSGLLDTAIELGVIKQTGNFYYFNEAKWQGRKSLRDAFLVEALQEQLVAAIAATGNSAEDGEYIELEELEELE